MHSRTALWPRKDPSKMPPKTDRESSRIWHVFMVWQRVRDRGQQRPGNPFTKWQLLLLLARAARAIEYKADGLQKQPLVDNVSVLSYSFVALLQQQQQQQAKLVVINAISTASHCIQYCRHKLPFLVFGSTLHDGVFYLMYFIIAVPYRSYRNHWPSCPPRLNYILSTIKYSIGAVQQHYGTYPPKEAA